MSKFENFIKAIAKINMTNIVILSVLFTWMISYHYGVFYKHELTAGQEKSLERLDYLMQFICGIVVGRASAEVKKEYNNLNDSGA
jgi:hypothetical protein